MQQDKRLSQEWIVPQGVVVLPAMTKLPAGTQLLSRTQKGGKLSPLLSKELESKPGASVFRVGIPWSYVEFIREASKHGHPYQAGHLDPPIEVNQLPQGCVVNSRFPLRQGAKVRPIDNYSSSLVNDTVTVSEKPLLHNVDEVAVLVSRFRPQRKIEMDSCLGRRQT